MKNPRIPVNGVGSGRISRQPIIREGMNSR